MNPWITIAVVLVLVLLSFRMGWMYGYRRYRQRPDLADHNNGSDYIGAMAAGVVHELAQPLSAARISVEGLHYLRQIGREPSPGQMTKTLDRVGMSLLAMMQILDHLRFLAGGKSRSQTPIDLRQVVDALVADRVNWLRWSDVRIEIAGSTQPCQALGDRVGLRLILANLVRNAAEAIALLPEDRNWIRITVGPGPRITVEDPGPGVPAAIAGKLFEPFVSSRGEARGLGLSLARAAAERMGGRLSWISNSGAGRGTVFALDLMDVRFQS